MSAAYRWIVILGALLIAGLCTVPVKAYWQSRLQVSVGNTSTYVGPADVSGWSGPLAWYGLRAVSNAYAATLGPAMDVQPAGGGATTTIHVKTDGSLNQAEFPVGSNEVHKIYDQIGTNHITLSLGTAPLVVMNSIGGAFPGIALTAAHATEMVGTTSLAQSQPLTMAAVIRQDANGFGHIFGGVTGNYTGFFTSSTNGFSSLFAGTQANYVMTLSTYHSSIALFNGASSTVFVDAASQTLSANPGATGVTTPSLGNNSFPADATWIEAGVWAGDKTANVSALNTNQHGTNGYNF